MSLIAAKKSLFRRKMDQLRKSQKISFNRYMQRGAPRPPPQDL